MLSISQPMKSGQGNYYAELANGKYYTEGGEPPGEWFGSGSGELGLEGVVKAEEFQNLLRGYNAKGDEALVRNAVKSGDEKGSLRQCGWDLTFSAPKSVSVLWSQADEETRKMIEGLQARAVSAALNYLEEEAACSRIGKAGEERVKARLVFARFRHHTSRAGDAQLHEHCILINTAVRGEDGGTGTIVSKDIFKNKMTAGALYRAELSRLLHEELGIKTQRKEGWFEVTGVPEELINEFSKRRLEILERLSEKGYSSAKAAKVANLDTRKVKEHRALSELLAEWQEIGRSFGFGDREASALKTGVSYKTTEEERIKDISEKALSRAVEHQSYFTRRELVRYVSEESQCLGFGKSEILEITKRILGSEYVVSLDEAQWERLYTTKDMLSLEQEMIQGVATQEKDFCTIREELIARALESRREAEKPLSGEQEGALKQILQTGDRIITITGMAGTGKTHMLSAAREALENGNYKVLGAALSGKAAEGLEEGSGIKSSTIASLLIKYRSGALFFDNKTVLVVDEAGMVGTRDMHSLVRIARSHGTKLVLVGDDRQLQPVAAGGAFRKIIENIGTVKLTEIRRQKDNWARGAVHMFADGKAQAGLQAYAARGLLDVSEDREGAQVRLVAEWAEYSGMARENIMLAGTNEEVGILNREAQLIRREKQELGEKFIDIQGRRYYEGDRILFLKNDRRLGVKNGSFGEIVRINSGINSLVVRLDNQNKIIVPTGAYKDFKLGYAMTSHKSQGITVERSFVLVGGEMQDREITYVQVSRAKGDTKLFTDRLSAGEAATNLAREMSTSRQKDLAVDHLRKEPGVSANKIKSAALQTEGGGIKMRAGDVAAEYNKYREEIEAVAAKLSEKSRLLKYRLENCFNDAAIGEQASEVVKERIIKTSGRYREVRGEILGIRKNISTTESELKQCGAFDIFKAKELRAKIAELQSTEAGRLKDMQNIFNSPLAKADANEVVERLLEERECLQNKITKIDVEAKKRKAEALHIFHYQELLKRFPEEQIRVRRGKGGQVEVFLEDLERLQKKATMTSQRKMGFSHGR